MAGHERHPILFGSSQECNVSTLFVARPKGEQVV